MAVIGHKGLQDHYNLTCIKENIHDHENNTTRFLLMTTQQGSYEKQSKTSIVCGLEYDKPGSLFDLLQIFKQYGSNLTHIASRPTKQFLGQYVFFIDYESPLSEQTHNELLEHIHDHCLSFRFLGSYLPQNLTE